MPRRRELRGVAAGLLGSFVSRNNDIGGYWGLGKLYRRAIELGVREISIDLLDRTPPRDEFGEMTMRFRMKLGEQLSVRNIPIDRVATAIVHVEFSGVKSPTMPGDVFRCTVSITDDKGRAHAVSDDGACWAYDPRREQKGKVGSG